MGDPTGDAARRFSAAPALYCLARAVYSQSSLLNSIKLKNTNYLNPIVLIYIMAFLRPTVKRGKLGQHQINAPNNENCPSGRQMC
jgi:hypothetical protein